jgi:DNA-binding transcriptional regulator YhcF (GntR family)
MWQPLMLNLWFVHSSEVSLPEQIVTQVRMAVLAGDLQPGERLPSVRGLARRFGLHHNTVSAAYRRLEQEGLVSLRRGSGVYVRTGSGASDSIAGVGILDDGRKIRRAPAESDLERMLARTAKLAEALGISADEMQDRLRAALLRSREPRIERVVLIEPDEELLRIAIAELRAALPLPVQGCGTVGSQKAGTLLAALPSHADAVRQSVGDKALFVALRIRSAAGSLAVHLPGPKTELIGLVSRWPRFLEIGRTMLLATGLPPEALVVRDAREAGWLDSLDQMWAVVCDSHTAECLPVSVRALPFALIAEESLAEVRAFGARDIVV